MWRWLNRAVVEARKRMLSKLSRSHGACPVECHDMRLAGIEPEGNPYDIYTEEHGEWDRGYVHAGIDQDS